MILRGWGGGSEAGAVRGSLGVIGGGKGTSMCLKVAKPEYFFDFSIGQVLRFRGGVIKSVLA